MSEIEEETTEDVTELNLAGDGREENGGKRYVTEVDVTFQETRRINALRASACLSVTATTP